MPSIESGEPDTRAGPCWFAARQQPGGGWGYDRNPWTEPTALALLALSTEPVEYKPFVRAAIGWLRRARRPGGGWPPNPSVDRSVTWATSLALLALTSATGEPCTESVRWLLDTSGRETSLSFRLIRILSGTGNPDREGFEGWPWYPGTAAWVAPTGMAIRALEKASPLQPPHIERRIKERVQLGRKFLLARRCLDGGWNHGSSRPLGYEAESYPETTGVALIGLTGTPRAVLERSLQRAAVEFAECPSAQGRAWLRLALASHAYRVPVAGNEPAYRDITDAALDVVARAAERGRNVFAE